MSEEGYSFGKTAAEVQADGNSLDAHVRAMALDMALRVDTQLERSAADIVETAGLFHDFLAGSIPRKAS